MRNIITLLVSLLLSSAGATNISPNHAYVETLSPIVAYLSPPSLFLKDDSSINFAKQYKPLAVYDAPNGKVIGSIVMSQPECFESMNSTLGPQCKDAGVHTLMIKQQPNDILLGEYGYEEKGLVTFQPIIHSKGKMWAAIQSLVGTVYVNVNKKDIYYYDERTSLILDFDTWCTMPGVCQPVSKKMQQQMKILAPENGPSWFAGCYSDVYTIESRSVVNNIKYYKVKLAEFIAGAPKVDLPATGYIPSRKKDGQHTGHFYSRGC